MSFIKVNYNEETKRLRYPECKIEEFLKKLCTEFKISPHTNIVLYEGNDSLSGDDTLSELGIEKGSTLILKSNSEKRKYMVKIQKANGDIQQFPFDDGSTVKDVYDAAQTLIDAQSTYPLLFNHRMHIFKTKQFSTEPLINLLKLTPIDDENIPHFYLFECALKFEMFTYKYVKETKNIYLNDDLWQPASEKQTNESMMIYLNTMYALFSAFSRKKEADFDSFHEAYMPQFLIVLRQYLFPPACLAFKHAMEGAVFSFEKQLLSEALFQLFRSLLPQKIENKNLFSYTSHVFFWIFQNANHTSAEHTFYESVEITKRPNSNTNRSAQTDGRTLQFYTNPVRIMSEKIAGAHDRVILMEYQDASNLSNLTNDDYQQQTDLVGLLLLLRENKKTNSEHEELEEQDLFRQYSGDYTLWIPNSTSLNIRANVLEQKQNLNKLTDKDMENIQQELAKNDLYSIFTFAYAESLSKYHHAQLVQLGSNRIVYLLSARKLSDIPESFNCFDPFGESSWFNKSDASSRETIEGRPGVVIREDPADIRKIEQITCILFDISGSMHMEVGEEGKKNSLLELSSMAFGAWRDRLVSYRLPHAIGLIYFGANDEPTINTLEEYRLHSRRRGFMRDLMNLPIVVKCPITRELDRFERALGDRPECGFDTPLYNAIDKGIEEIQRFREQSTSKLSPTCKKMILCLTDGSDTCSKAKPDIILEKMINHDIVFDAISFDSTINNVLVNFCEKTTGYYYLEIPRNKESLLELFELEAAISLQDREENSYGQIRHPKRRQAKDLDKPAVSSKSARLGDGSASSTLLRRVMREINHLNKKELRNFDLFISKENIMFWKLIMHGEVGTPYSDGRWLLYIQFPSNYPEKPPEIRFVTKIYHCNINDDGKICHDVLTNAWSQKTSMYDILMQILSLLKEPNADDALSAVKGTQYKNSIEDYNNTIIEWKMKYASDSIDALKAKYFLE